MRKLPISRFATYLVILVLGLGLTACTHRQVDTVNEQGSSNTVQDTNVIVQNINLNNSDWLTYTNEEYGLNFKYPPNWDIKQQWLENGLQGKKYNIFLQNQEAKSILIYLTTKDFISEEGEGDTLYITGEPLTNKIEDLKKRGLPIYTGYDKQVEIENTFYIVTTYGGTKLSLLTLRENQEKQFLFLTLNSPLLFDWDTVVDSSEVDAAIESYEAHNSPNQSSIDEYLMLIKTVQY